MRKFLKILLLSMICCLGFAASAHCEVISYPVPDGDVRMNPDYVVRVCDEGKNNWKTVPVYGARSVEIPVWGNGASLDVGLAYFDMSGPVTVEITTKREGEQVFNIRPEESVEFEQIGKTVRFTLTEPKKLSVELNGNRHTNLMLYANPIEDYKEILNSGKNLIYFGPGLYTKDNCIYINQDYQMRIPSNTVVFVDGGAVVRGSMWFEHAENSALIGHGILDFDPYNRPDATFDQEPYQRGIVVDTCKNITIDGVIVKNPPYYTLAGYASDNIKVNNIKSISASLWADGIDMVCTSNVDINDCFIRSADDSLAIYASRFEWYGDSRDWDIRNSIFWSDVAHSINIGTHGGQDDNAKDFIENINIHDIVILESRCENDDFNGSMTINCGDGNIIRNINFENVRVEDLTKGRLIYLNTGMSGDYNPIPGYVTEDITFKNISWNDPTGDDTNSLFKGWSEDRVLKNIRIENLTHNGEPVNDLSHFEIRPYVYNLVLVDENGNEVVAPVVYPEEEEDSGVSKELAYLLKRAENLKLDGDLSDWKDYDFIHFPQQTTDDPNNIIVEYKGEDDLSFDYAMSYDDQNLYLALDIKDDVHCMDSEYFWENDDVQIAVGTPDSFGPEYSFDDRGTYSASDFDGKTPLGHSSMNVKYQKGENGNIVYEVSVPWLALFTEKPTTDFQFTMLINENDGAGRRGVIRWSKGIDDVKTIVEAPWLGFDLSEQYFDIAGHWAQDYLEQSIKRGILSGDGTGRVNPDNKVTRAEYATLVCRTVGLENINYDGVFKDVNKGAWYANYARTIYGYGAVAPQMIQDGKFNPSAPVTREEAVYILAKALAQKYDEVYANGESTFKDNANIASWARSSVEYLKNKGIVVGTDGKFNPKDQLTRAESCVMLLNTKLLLKID